MIPKIDLARLIAADPDALAAMREAATDIGFATVYNTPLGADRVNEAIGLYRAFFNLPEAEKRAYDMALTGSNRGWGATGSEQVDGQEAHGLLLAAPGRPQGQGVHETG